jgi:hypothetical protein
MPPRELDEYIRGHWSEWEGQWMLVGSGHGLNSILRVDAGQPIYLVQRGASHYLVANATPLPDNAAA